MDKILAANMLLIEGARHIKKTQRITQVHENVGRAVQMRELQDQVAIQHEQHARGISGTKQCRSQQTVGLCFSFGSEHVRKQHQGQEQEIEKLERKNKCALHTWWLLG